MKIAVASGSRLRATALRRGAAGVTGHVVAWVAANGSDTVRLCAADAPDLLLLDLEIPGIDSVEVTRRVMREAPCAIVIVSADRARTPAVVSRIYEAMGLGALDVVPAPVVNRQGELRGSTPLEQKIRTVDRLIGANLPEENPEDEASGSPLIVALGASTGGPQALAEVLGRLPKDLRAALLIAQHVEPAYAPGLASWLSEKTGFPVEHVPVGAKPRRGMALLFADDHAVNALFRSLVGHVPPGIAVVLTGMGSDGADGLLELRRVGWTTICQDERTSIVFGMPKAAADVGAAGAVLPLEAIGPTIVAAVERVTR